jgi:flavin-dependent dehydrogenase
MTDIVVVGGGLAGLINSILLNRKGYQVTLVEKKEYPFHRVCGEYISNEVIPFLKSEDLFPEKYEPAEINQFQLTSVAGRSLQLPLDLGGFGISRFTFDHWLAGIAKKEGVDVREKTTVEQIEFINDSFAVELRGNEKLFSKVVIGAFGKRSALDKNLDRQFIKESSPYIGVKYHIKTNEVAHDLVALHNFEGGYCGVSRIEDQKYNLCYLSRRDTLKPYANIEEMEADVLHRNPYLKSIYSNSEFLFEKPEVINEISFSPKEAVFEHVLMAGDAAGMITPLY